VRNKNVTEKMKIITAVTLALISLILAACESPTATNAARIANTQAEATGSPFRWESKNVEGGAILTLVMVDLSSGPTRADALLKHDIVALIEKAEAAEGRSAPQVEDVKPLKDGREVWILKSDKDGIAYIVGFKPSSQGGTDIELSGPKKYQRKTVTAPPGATPTYSLKAATDAAAAILPKGPAKFALFNLSAGNYSAGDVAHLHELLSMAKGGKIFVAITSPQTEYIRNILADIMKQAKDEHFAGLNLIIVGDHVDEAIFASILKDREILVKYTTYR
jgi:hypothetical protein